MDGDNRGPGAEEPRVRVRRLGKFPGPDAESRAAHPSNVSRRLSAVPDEPLDPDEALATLKVLRSASERTRSIVGLLLLALGGVLIAVGIGFTFGWPWGLTTLGSLMLVMGFLFANE